MPFNKTKWFEDNVQGLVNKIADLCKEQGLPFLLVVQIAESEVKDGFTYKLAKAEDPGKYTVEETDPLVMTAQMVLDHALSDSILVLAQLVEAGMEDRSDEKIVILDGPDVIPMAPKGPGPARAQ